MKMSGVVVVAAIRPWNIAEYKKWKPPQGYRKVLITKKDELTAARLEKLAPRYVLIPHWSWIIPADVYERFECIVFHMTDLPFGRGGSPLQNLITRGVYATKVSAIRVMKGIDTGPVYLKRRLDLARGSAEELYKTFATVAFEMMTDILMRAPKPKPQKGRVVSFPRRTPEMSRLPATGTARQFYDFIRMLDAPEYPRAFLDADSVRLEFSNARLHNGRCLADVEIRSV